MHTFTYTILTIGKYPCWMAFARLASLAVLTRATLIDKRKCTSCNREEARNGFIKIHLRACYYVLIPFHVYSI